MLMPPLFTAPAGEGERNVTEERTEKINRAVPFECNHTSVLKSAFNLDPNKTILLCLYI